MSLRDSETSLKRTATSPLSEGEEVDDPSSRRSRMKRINLAELIAEESQAPLEEKTGVLNNVEEWILIQLTSHL